MTKEELQQMIGGIVSETVAKTVKEAQEKTADAKSDAAKPSNKSLIDSVIEDRNSRVVKEQSEDPGIAAARYIRCLAVSNGDPTRASNMAMKMGDRTIAKALSEGTDSAGGYLVPENLADSIISALRARTVVRRSGVPTIPLDNGTLTMPKVATATSAAWVGEGSQITTTDPVFSTITLTAKKLAALTSMSNELLADSRPEVDRIVRDDLVAAAAVKEDETFIRATGSATQPSGIKDLTPAGNVVASAGATVANMTDDMGGLIQKLMEGNCPMLNPTWLLAPRSYTGLITARDANSNLVWAQEMANGTLMGYKYLVTSSIPVNLGAGSDSEVYLYDPSGLIIGDASDVRVQISDSAAYYDGANVQSAWSNDQSSIRLILRTDLQARQDACLSYLSGVTWGS